MSSSKYRGNSRDKDFERARAYNKIQKRRFLNQKHIVIAGHCGDIKYLLEYGVNPKNIIACDRRDDYRYQAKRYGVIVPPDIHGTDIVSATKWAIDKFGERSIVSVNVDLCVSLIYGLPILRKIIELANWNETQFFYTFRCGRDKGLAKNNNEPLPGNKRRGKLIGFLNELNWEVGGVEFYPYSSWTINSRGSPMCIAHL